MKQKNDAFWLLTCVVVAIAATYAALYYMVLDPCHMINQLGGDAGKNYYAFIYHTVYGHGFWFDGINYPYGEHIIYADGLPALSVFLQLFHLSASQAVGAMNLSIAASYVLGIVFVYRILMRFKVLPIVALLFSPLVILLSPQLVRVIAHFGLSFVCVVPMLLYFTIRYNDTGKWRWLTYIFFLGAVSSFLHLYNGGMIFLWTTFYIVGYLLFQKGIFSGKLKHLTPLVVTTAVLFALIRVVIYETDPLKDRPLPKNGLNYLAGLNDFYTSPFSSLWHIIDKWHAFVITLAGEGFNYIGLAAILILIISATKGLVALLHGRGSLIVSGSGFSPIWLFAGGCALLISMGIPFIWMHSLLDYIPLFKQFRTMGRFGWLFYYVIAIYSVIALNGWIVVAIQSGKRFAGVLMMTATLLLWGADVFGYVRFVRSNLDRGPEISKDFLTNEQNDWQAFLHQHGLNSEDFQAIVLFPVFISSSDKIATGGDPSWALALGAGACVQLHLPMVDIFAARGSWSQAEKQVKTLGGPYTDKPMLRDLKNRKPFLLLRYDQAVLDPDQFYLISHADTIGYYRREYVLRCYPDSLLASDQRKRDEVNQMTGNMASGDTCIAGAGSWYVNHFDDQKASRRFFGAGALPCNPDSERVVATIKVKPAYDNETYEFSSWFLIDSLQWHNPYYILYLKDSTGRQIDALSVPVFTSTDNESMWLRASGYFAVRKECAAITCVLNNKPKSPTYIAMDEMMLRPAESVIVSKSADGDVMVNNHLLRRGGSR